MKKLTPSHKTAKIENVLKDISHRENSKLFEQRVNLSKPIVTTVYNKILKDWKSIIKL